MAIADNRISREEYLQGELASEIRHEYVAGNVYAMSGGTVPASGGKPLPVRTPSSISPKWASQSLWRISTRTWTEDPVSHH